MAEVPVEEAIYTAGLLDADGSVSINMEGGNLWPKPKIQLSSSIEYMVEYLHETWGGFRVEFKSKAGNIQYGWRMSKKEEVIKLGLAIAPYVKVKAAQWALVLRFHSLERNLDQDIALMIECQELNKLNLSRSKYEETDNG